MPGHNSQLSLTNQVSRPLPEAMPALNRVLANAQMFDPSLTANQTDALNKTIALARAGNPYAPAIDSYIATALAGGGPDRSGLLGDAYNSYKANLAGTAAGDYLDPNRNPFFAQTTSAISDNVQNRINSQFAKAGRDLSGSNLLAVAKGITEATAPVYADVWNKEHDRQLAANNALMNASQQFTSLLSGLDQSRLGNQGTGVSAANAAYNAAFDAYNRIVAGDTQKNSIPLSLLTQLANIVTPIAKTGGSTSGTTTTEATSFDPMRLLGLTGLLSGGRGLGAGVGGAGLSGLFGGTGAAGAGLTGAAEAAAGIGAGAAGLESAAAWIPFLALSDARVKDNIAPIGMLFDGTPVYSFNYIGDRTPRMGLIAQDVERRRPDAVGSVGGIKAVDYGKATQRARRIGGLLDKIAYR